MYVIFFTKGPVSYSGVRVVITIAKTLSVVSSIHIKVISSLAAYAGLKTCVSVIDARSQKVFVCAYQNGQALGEEQLLAIKDFDEFMKTYEGYQVVGQCEVVKLPLAEVNLGQNLYELSQKIEPIENVDALVPCYLKDVEAKQICL